LGRLQGLPYESTWDLLLPDPRAEGAPNGSYGKDEIEPGRLVMAARSIRSVRLSLTNSEQNDEGVARPERVPFVRYAYGQPGTKSARASSPCGGIGAVPPAPRFSQRRLPHYQV
jgi:hypothetical protein